MECTFPTHLIRPGGRVILTGTTVTPNKKDVYINLSNGRYVVHVHDRTIPEPRFKSYGWTQTMLDYCIQDIKSEHRPANPDFDPGSNARQHVNLAATVIAALSTRGRVNYDLRHHVETEPARIRCYIEYQKPGHERTWIYEYVLTMDEDQEVQVQFNWHNWRNLNSLYQNKPTPPSKDPFVVMMSQALVDALRISMITPAKIV